MFLDRLKEAMKNSGVNQTRLSEMTGLSKSGISQYCSGTHKPGKKALELIAEALNVSPEWLDDIYLMQEEPRHTTNRRNVMKPAEAARILGCNPQAIREGLKSGQLKYGNAVRMPSGKWHYSIYIPKFTQITGIEVI